MESWSIAKVLSWASQDLRERGSPSPRLDAELLLAHVLHCDRIKLITDSERPLEPEELAAYRELHKRRRRGEPVAYLRGEREFYGRSFLVDPRVLVPRPETELLVDVALRRTRHLSLSARVVDLCTGSGCVAITLKKERPTTLVLGGDVSTDALAVAARNAERLGALVGFLRSDLFEGFAPCRGKIDLLTANPPYIPDEEMAELPRDVRDFEPRLALASGGDGLELTRRIVAAAPDMLAPGGVLAVEVMAGSAEPVCELFAASGLVDRAVERDFGGHDRIVSGRRPV
jgi:release factor glutamine methyltransferase